MFGSDPFNNNIVQRICSLLGWKNQNWTCVSDPNSPEPTGSVGFNAGKQFVGSDRDQNLQINTEPRTPVRQVLINRNVDQNRTGSLIGSEPLTAAGAT